MSRVILKLALDGIAGSSVQECAAELIRVAGVLGVMTEMDLNGVQLIALGTTTMDELRQDYERGLKERP